MTGPADRPEQPPDPLAWIDDAMRQFEAADLRRRVVPRRGPQSVEMRIGDDALVSFASNDYLALASDPRLAEAAATAARDEGWGSGASPLLGGAAASHAALEAELAVFEGTEAALLFSSGFAANLGAVAALVGAGDVVFADAKNHASLLDGCRLSRADVRVYPHGNLDRLAALLKRATQRRRLIVTDSLFSMDGDFAPLPPLADLAARHNAMLLIDEAHATGVFGAGGRGVAEQLGVHEGIHIRVGTLSKALGSSGGFVAGSRTLINWFVQRARSYVFSTAMPAPVAAAARAALRVVQEEPQRRRTLLARAEQLRTALRGDGWDLGDSSSQIIPLIVGDPAEALALSARLRAAGFFVPAIRPPTVAEGESRLRLSLSYAHSEAMIDGLRAALRQCQPD